MIVNRITPTQIGIESASVINGAIIKIEIGVPMPRTPTIGGCVVLDYPHLWCSAIGGNLNIFYIKLFATFGNNMKFHPPIFDMSRDRNLDSFRAILCAKDEGIAISCFRGVLVMVTATCCLSFGITNPYTPRNRFIMVVDLKLVRFTFVANQNFNGLRATWDFK